MSESEGIVWMMQVWRDGYQDSDAADRWRLSDVYILLASRWARVVVALVLHCDCDSRTRSTQVRGGDASRSLVISPLDEDIEYEFTWSLQGRAHDVYRMRWRSKVRVVVLL